MRTHLPKLLLIAAVALGVLILAAPDGAVAGGKDEIKDKYAMFGPDSDVGADHVRMYQAFGAMDCAGCHNGEGLDAAPSLHGMSKVRMGGNKACAQCHDDDKAPLLFISLMNDGPVVYDRCEDCHDVK